MALPILATLSVKARTAYPLIRRMVAQGMGLNAIQDTLKGTVLALRRETLGKIVRAERNIFTFGAALKYLNLNHKPNPDRIPEALTIISKNFSFEVSVIGFDQAIGERVERFVTVVSDENLFRWEIEDTARFMIENNPQRYPFIIEKITPIKALKAGKLGTGL